MTHLFCALLLLALSPVVDANSLDIYPFNSSAKQQQFQQVIQQMRCLVCQNENLADSNAGLAKDLRKEIYTMVQQGYSNAQIEKHFVERYGHFILFKPPMNLTTYLLWIGPFTLLMIAFIALLILIRKNKKEKSPCELSEEEKEKLQSLLNKYNL